MMSFFKKIIIYVVTISKLCYLFKVFFENYMYKITKGGNLLMNKIFVYGSLRQGMYNYDKYLKSENTFRCKAYIQGSLYTIKNELSPALLLEGHHMIVGEIHEVSHETMKTLDDMEGYILENDDHNEYDKIVCDIYDENQQIIDQLPTYVFNMRNPNNKERLGTFIDCLDYVEYMKKAETK